MKRFLQATLLSTISLFLLSTVSFANEAKEQTTCPVMGGKINKDLFVEHEGKKIYVCCKGCIAAIEKDPEKYLAKLEKEGVVLEKSAKHKAKNACFVCPNCGEKLGSELCCKTEGRETCDQCGLLKGSLGCCKLPKDSKHPYVCDKCGELAGSEKCCNLEGRKKCDKCGLLKGSLGCFKLGDAAKEGKDALRVCLHCGELKGSETCCVFKDRKQCDKCGLLKGSLACCKLTDGFKKPHPICSECKEPKCPTKECCKLAPKDKKACCSTDGKCGVGKTTEKSGCGLSEKGGCAASAKGKDDLKERDHATEEKKSHDHEH